LVWRISCNFDWRVSLFVLFSAANIQGIWATLLYVVFDLQYFYL
jgi:hypothetical protein